MRRPLLALLSAAALLATTAACGGSGSDSGKGGTDKVTAGVIPIVDVAPIYLGKQQGFFSERGIDLTLQTGSGGAASVPGVVSGQYQFAFGNVTSLLVARDKKLPLKVLTNGVSSIGVAGKDFGAVVVKSSSPITSAKDLAGKKVSVNNLSNIGDTTVRASVRKAGGDPAKVQFVELPFPDMPAALQNSRVDAAWVVEPFLTQALSQGARPVAWNFVDAAPNLSVATYFTSERMLKEKPDLVKRFTAAMNESLAYADGHPDEVRKILGTYTKIPADVIAKMTLPKFPAEVNRASIQTLADLALQDGLVKSKPDVAALLSELG
ncbi:MAG: putative aliphatic sulfonates-binding protein [Mycobacterium sp.]|nr:putative aliphatic sulfonates-binding protein [Mycobacterium sp.]